jgi:two-component system cell cycle response regulator DivK
VLYLLKEGGFMPKTVLIVEDYDDSRSYIKFAVESYGYQVIEACDGLEAIDRFKQFHPDLILMDISLPVVDGLTTTKAIREFDGVHHIPIIAVTSFGNLYYKQAIEAGCDELISKPVDIELLAPIIDKYIGH